MTLELIEKTFITLVKLKAAAVKSAGEVDRCYSQLRAEQYRRSCPLEEQRRRESAAAEMDEGDFQYRTILLGKKDRANKQDARAATSPLPKGGSGKKTEHSFKTKVLLEPVLDENGLNINDPQFQIMMLAMNALKNSLRKRANSTLIITKFLKEIAISEEDKSWADLAETTSRVTLEILKSEIEYESQVEEANLYLAMARNDHRLAEKAFLAASAILESTLGSS